MAGALLTPVKACDLCAIYSVSQARGQMGHGWFSGVAEQFTHQGTLQMDGAKVPNAEGQKLDGSVTQVIAGYNFTEYFGLQLNLPVIHRSFQRTTATAGVNETGSVSGPGDLAFVANWSPWHYQSENGIFRWTVLGGLKLPTGGTGRLHEEVDELTAPRAVPDSAVHGHDLTLGSGSVDGIIGTGFFASHNRLFFSAGTQYALRSTGDFDYRFANDLSWSGGPGVFLKTGGKLTASLQANISGEYKPRDSFQGVKSDDTGITTVFVGPQFNVTWKDNLSAEFGVDVPVIRENTALQTVPDYRIRAAVNWRF